MTKLADRLSDARRFSAPRRELTETEMFPCPWCGAPQDDSHPSDAGPGPFDCTVCRKEFCTFLEEDGSLWTQGLITESDKKYLAWKNQHKTLSGQG